MTLISISDEGQDSENKGERPGGTPVGIEGQICADRVVDIGRKRLPGIGRNCEKKGKG